MEGWPLESSMLENKEMEHWGGTGEHSEREHVGEEGGMSTNPFETYPNLQVRAVSGDNIEINLEMVAGESPSSTSSSEGIDMDIDVSMSSINHHLRATPSVKLDSPSSSTSSEDLFIVLDPKPDSSTLLLIDCPITTRQGNANATAASSCNSSESEEKRDDGFSGPMLLSPDPDMKPRIHPAPPTKSPPLQVMDRTTADGYDPYRIPASIFDKSPSATPQDWSVASNESLFSIHIGNSSFSRDHAYMLGDFKSGELFALSPKPPFAAPSPVPRSPVCASIDKSNHHPFQTGKNVVVVPPIAEGNEMEATKKQVDEEEHNSHAAIRVSSIKYSRKISKHSHSGSGDSVKSFAFPITKKKCSWPSCYGCNRSQALRYCTCPKKCPWPPCYGCNCRQALRQCTCLKKCSWPSCYGCNCSQPLRYCTCLRCYIRWPCCHFCCCSRKGWYCCSSCNLTDRVRSDCDKTSEDQDHHTANIEENLQPSWTPNTPTSTSKQGGRGWFSCFPSWCSCSCPFRSCRCCC